MSEPTVTWAHTADEATDRAINRDIRIVRKFFIFNFVLITIYISVVHAEVKRSFKTDNKCFPFSTRERRKA
jgi:hypothetical protein